MELWLPMFAGVVIPPHTSEHLPRQDPIYHTRVGVFPRTPPQRSLLDGCYDKSAIHAVRILALPGLPVIGVTAV